MKSRSKRMLGFLIALAMVSASVYVVCAEAETQLQYAPAEEVGRLAVKELSESSGLACSRINSNILWTHNDSGDQARLFAIDTSGAFVGMHRVTGATALDWEDMASFSKDGQPYLLVADTGDNTRQRKEYLLYRVPETPASDGSLAVDQVVKFKYDAGPCDCEAIAYDTTLDQVILIDKGWNLRCRVFALDWPETPTKKTLTAKKIAVLKVAGITGLDISPDGRRAIALTYGPAYEYVREPGESWKKAFSRAGRLIRLPVRRQGEAICYGADGKELFLTSEQRPTPLYRVGVTAAGESGDEPPAHAQETKP